jgi:hypothetical protein
MKRGILVFIGLLLLVAVMWVVVVFFGEKIKSGYCRVSGGVYAPVPGWGRGNYCYYPPKDLGKTCYQNSECERNYCYYYGKRDQAGYLLGECGDTKCAYTLKEKTKDNSNLEKKNCVVF